MPVRAHAIWPRTSDRGAPRRWRRAALVGLLLCAHIGLAQGCSQPCDELQVRLCDVLKEKRRCELMNDEERRAVLTRDTCQSILDKLNRR